MLNKNLDSKLGELSAEAKELLGSLQGQSESLAENYESRNFAVAIRQICSLADEVNRYLDCRKPWQMVKSEPEHARETLTTSLNAVRLLAIYLKCVLPEFAGKIESLLGIEPLQWSDVDTLLENHQIKPFERLMERVDPKKVQDMIEESKDKEVSKQQVSAEPSPLESEPLAEQISFEDFMKVDLRVAAVLKAELVEGADKLLRLELELGGETRTVLAGIRQAYEPDQLVGKKMVVVANLAPRKMKFGVSEGMILAAGPGGKEIFVLGVDEGGKPGQRVH